MSERASAEGTLTGIRADLAREDRRALLHARIGVGLRALHASARLASGVGSRSRARVAAHEPRWTALRVGRSAPANPDLHLFARFLTLTLTRTSAALKIVKKRERTMMRRSAEFFERKKKTIHNPLEASIIV